MPKVPPAKKSKQAQGDLVHPNIRIESFIPEQGTGFTSEHAKKLLGWLETPEKTEQSVPEVEKLVGVQAELRFNTNNRMISISWVEDLAQRILQKQWRFNSNFIAVGKHGNVQSGQHRCLAVIYAEYLRTAGPNAKALQKRLPDPITIPTGVIYGIEEDDATFATLNAEKANTLADVVFRSELTKGMAQAARKKFAKACDSTLKHIWNRTHASDNPFAPIRNHSESLQFLSDHPKLVKSIKFMVDNDDEGSVSELIPVGLASALHYLMATCMSDGEKYRAKFPRKESGLDFSKQDLADEFFTLLLAKDKDMKGIRPALANLTDPETGLGGTLNEKIGVLIKAWNLFGKGKKPNDEDKLKLEYTTIPVDGEERRYQTEFPIINGIDVGDAPELPEADEELTTEELEARKKAEKDGKTVIGAKKQTVAHDHGFGENADEDGVVEGVDENGFPVSYDDEPTEEVEPEPQPEPEEGIKPTKAKTKAQLAREEALKRNPGL